MNSPGTTASEAVAGPAEAARGPELRWPSHGAWFIAGFALAFSVLLAIAAVSYRSVNQYAASAQWVDHTHLTIGNLDEVMYKLKDAEIWQHGFLVTGDERHLQFYIKAAEAIPSLLRSLKLRIRDPRQQAALPVLTELTTLKLELMESRIHLKKSGRPADASLVKRDWEVTDRIRVLVEGMKADERRLLAQASDELESDSADTRRVIVLGNLTALFVLLTTAGLLLRAIAARKRTEAERERFFTLALDLLCIVGTDGYFKRLNPAFNQTLGYTTDELMARPLFDFIHPDDYAATLAAMKQLHRGEPLFQFENRYRCKDGSWRWLSWRVQPFPSEGLLYSTARDVTDRKAVEAAIERLNADLIARAAQLDAANQELESFSYSVSHDLRSPLRAIGGYALMLEEDYREGLDEEGRRLLRTVRDNAARMARLIDDLLAFSRLGRAAINAANIDMETLAREAAAQLPRDGVSTRTQLRIEALPAAFADRALLRQVWLNLLGNALKYSAKRDAPLIEVSGRVEGGECIYCVKDNGAGFDMRYYDKLFGVFQRLHGADEFAGTGVGLAIVQRIVMRHGGRVWAEGKPDAGAHFYFSLPVKESDHA